MLSDVPDRMLTTRELNRALLARQGLLDRTRQAPAAMVERLVGLQAQVPSNPYVALWSRIEGFDPAALSTLLEERRAVRGQLMRTTIHLVTARDARVLHPLMAPVHARVFTSNFARRLAGADVEEVVRAGRALLGDGAPRTRAAIGRALAPRWPEADVDALGQAVAHHTPLVQATPRGLWERAGQAELVRTEAWIGEELEPAPVLDDLVLRYLTAFGPATPADLRTWSGLAGAREVLDRLRPGLRVFRDEQGRELLDVPDGLLPDPDVPAPPRLLPEYDNVFLSHADRTRVTDGGGKILGPPTGRWFGYVFVDGRFRTSWRVTEAAGVATLDLTGLEVRAADPPGTREAVAQEAEALLAFLPLRSDRRDVRMSRA